MSAGPPTPPPIRFECDGHNARIAIIVALFLLNVFLILFVVAVSHAQPYTPGVQVKQGTSLIGQCPTLNFDATDFAFTKSGSVCTGQLGADIPHTGPYDTGTNFDPTNGVTSVPAVPFNFGAATSFTLPTALSFGGLSYTLPSSRTDSQCLKTGSGGTQGTLTWGSCGSGGLSNPATIDETADGTLYGSGATTKNLTLDANRADQTGAINLDSLVHLWPSLPTPASSTTTNLMTFDRSLTKSGSANPWYLIDISPTVTWQTTGGDYVALRAGGTINNTAAPSAYQFTIFKSTLTLQSSGSSGSKPFLPDTFADYTNVIHADTVAATESAWVAVSFLADMTLKAQGSDYTLSNSLQALTGLYFWPNFAAVSSHTLTISGPVSAVWARAPQENCAGGTCTFSGSYAGLWMDDPTTGTVDFAHNYSVKSLGATTSLVNAGCGRFGDTTDCTQKLEVAGNVLLDAASAELRLKGSSTGYTALKSGNASGTNYTFTLPADDGNAGEILKTDGSGVLTWVPPSETKCMTIDQPVNTDDVIWFKNQSGATITLTSANCIVAAATSATVQIKECDVNAATCGNSHTAVACTTSNTPITLTDTAVDSDDWMRVAVTATSGSPGHVTVCLTYSGAS